MAGSYGHKEGQHYQPIVARPSLVYLDYASGVSADGENLRLSPQKPTITMVL